MENEIQTIPEFDHSYLKDAVTVQELMEEVDAYVKDINNAQFNSTVDLQTGIRMGFMASMQVIQDFIERLEELSPDPENDPLITKLYIAYEAMEGMKNKCDYI